VLVEYECKSCKAKYNDEHGYTHACHSSIKNPRDENWKYIYDKGIREKVLKSEGKGRKKIQ